MSDQIHMFLRMRCCSKCGKNYQMEGTEVLCKRCWHGEPVEDTEQTDAPEAINPCR